METEYKIRAVLGWKMPEQRSEIWEVKVSLCNREEYSRIGNTRMTLEILESKFARKFGVHHEGFWCHSEIYEFFCK